MDVNEYLQSRLESQRDWYEKKANINKRQFMNYQKIIIVLGALIPVNVIVFTVFLDSSVQTLKFEGMISAVISAIIAIVAGFDKLSQPQTNWFNYRANEEILKKEKYLFEFKAGPYHGIQDKEAERLLVERVESVIASDIARFVQAEEKLEPNGEDKNSKGGLVPIKEIDK